MNNKLSADPTAMVLSIIGLVLLFLGCCCGLFAIVSLVLGIIALILSNKSIREYALEPENYNPKTYNNVKTARVLAVLAIVFSALIMIGQATFFAMNGEAFSRDFLEEIRKNGNFEYEFNSNEQQSTGDWNDDEGTIRLKKQGDSIVIDTTAADTTTVKN